MAPATVLTWEAASGATTEASSNSPLILWAGWTCHFHGATGVLQSPACSTIFEECKRLMEHYGRSHLTREQLKPLHALTRKKKLSSQEKWEAIGNYIVEHHIPQYACIDPALLQINSTEQQS